MLPSVACSVPLHTRRSPVQIPSSARTLVCCNKPKIPNEEANKARQEKKKEKSVACANQRPPCADRTSHSAAPSIDTHGTGRVALFCFWTGRSNWAGLDETRRDGKQACVSELEATTAAPVLSSQHLCATSGRGQQRLAQAQLRTRRQQGRRGHTEPTTKVPSLP